MPEEVSCFFGEFCSSPCHKVSQLYNGESKLIPVRSMAQRDQEILWRRTGASPTEDAFICSYHHAVLVTKFQFLQQTCCNPFGKDTYKKKKGLQPITIATATELERLLNRAFQPGQKLCPRCRIELKNRKSMQVVEPKENEYGDGIHFIEASTTANNSLDPLRDSPLRLDRTGKRYSLDYLDREDKRAKIDTSNTIADVTPGEDKDDEQGDNCRKCRDLNIIIPGLKAKFRESHHSMKLQILTLMPDSWSIEETAKKFECSTRLVKEARKLKTEAGIVAVPEKRKGKVLGEDIKKRILDFYESDEFSCMYPGKGDYVSLRIDGQRVRKQKRILLCNLKEIYVGYVKQYGSEIGFSKFCELRPKWCITMGTRGAHSCVCTTHQNVKLMLAVTPLQDDYKELLRKIVCSLESRNCMLGNCERCPGESQLKSYLKEAFKEYNPEEVLEFKQWIHTDKGTLGTINSTVEDFIEELTLKVSALKTHHFISKHQSQYLRQLKESDFNKEIIVLMDFSENYSFIMQDASQGLRWNKTQATVHPIIVYIPGVALRCLNFCMISDSLNHNVVAVYAFQQKLIQHLKLVLGQITRIHYFSVGSAQYKTYQNFNNLCFHEHDFGISAEWNFFGDSHGKSLCDVIGGTVKRLAGHANLQTTVKNQILTPQDLFHFCDHNILGIKFFYVPQEDIKAYNGPQQQRFSKSCALSDTSQYHQFKPISKTKIKVSRLSGDKKSHIIKLL